MPIISSASLTHEIPDVVGSQLSIKLGMIDGACPCGDNIFTQGLPTTQLNELKPAKFWLSVCIIRLNHFPYLENRYRLT